LAIVFALVSTFATAKKKKEWNGFQIIQPTA